MISKKGIVATSLDDFICPLYSSFCLDFRFTFTYLLVPDVEKVGSDRDRNDQVVPEMSSDLHQEGITCKTFNPSH